ncbi:MAG: penicillin-binding protein activator [Gammaproteobacteria bacterium]|nr:penicillin-binding protein activator [Gammaproteobacteria bacterium]
MAQITLERTPYRKKKETHGPLENETIAWINLAELAKDHPNDFPQLKSAVLNWKQQYPEHMANQLLSDINADDRPIPRSIAVLLPLSGLHADSGKSVQQGLLEAYYEAHERTSQSILFYDTNSVPIDELYPIIKAQGHDLILGPLTKEDTERLLNIADSSPAIISLNYTNQKYFHPHTYNLDFLLKMKHAKIADLAWRQGKSAAIIISPNTDKAKKITRAFTQAWITLGGTIIDRYYYQDTDKFAATIAKLLGITDSQSRQHKLHQTLLLHVNSTLYSRKDADMVFLVSDPTIARQVVPFIKFYAGNSLPVFATSQVNNGHDAINQNKDLNDLYFCDMTAAFQAREKNQNKLYFLGKDAYLLATQQTHLSALPHFPLTGNTGQLYLNPMMHTIQRELTCGQFKNGRATAFNTT